MESLLEHLKSWTALIDGLSFIGIVTGVAKTFEWFDGMVSDEGRAALSGYLNNLPSDEQIDSWGSVFPELIDRVFGPKALSLRFVLSSFVSSALGYLAVLLVGIRFRSNEISHFGWRYFYDYTAVEISIISFFVLNLGPDYISLIVSREIVRDMSKSAKHIFSLACLTFVGVFMTFIIGVFTSLLVGTSDEYSSHLFRWLFINPRTSRPVGLVGPLLICIFARSSPPSGCGYILDQ